MCRFRHFLVAFSLSFDHNQRQPCPCATANHDRPIHRGAEGSVEIPHRRQHGLGAAELRRLRPGHDGFDAAGFSQQQVFNIMFLKLDYVDSLNRWQYFMTMANTALYPGLGPVRAKELYPLWKAVPFFVEKASHSQSQCPIYLCR